MDKPAIDPRKPRAAGGKGRSKRFKRKPGSVAADRAAAAAAKRAAKASKPAGLAPAGAEGAQGSGAAAEVATPVPVTKRIRSRGRGVRGPLSAEQRLALIDPSKAAPDAPIVVEKASGPMAYEWKPLFLAKYEKTLSLAASYRFAGISKQGFQDARDRDEIFAQAIDDILEERTGKLKMRAFYRAEKGDDGPSAQILMFLLRAHDKATYGEVKANALIIGALNVTTIEKITAWTIASAPVTVEMEAEVLTPVSAVA